MINESKLMNLKNRLEGHNATCEPAGKPYVTAKGSFVLAKKAREYWAVTTEQSWTKTRLHKGQRTNEESRERK